MTNANLDSLPVAWKHQDIGPVEATGDGSWNNGVFTLKGTLDIWGSVDGFHLAWLPIEGDGQIIARVTAVDNTNEHAKSGVMFRESLEAGARHACMVVTPVDGVQFLRRPVANAATIPNNPRINRGVLPYWVKLVRQGDRFLGYESLDGVNWILCGVDTVAMPSRILVGLVGSSHSKTVVGTSKLDNVNTGRAPSPAKLRSDVTIVDLEGKTQVIYSSDKLFEAPNWSPDGKFLVLNSDSKLWRLPVSGGQPQLIPMGSVEAINNDHGISPDGKLLVVSARGGPMYTLPITGGEPTKVSPQIPSYYHGWSPDGRTLAYVARTTTAYDIYEIGVGGGEPARLTCDPGHDDGPDYSPDGKWVYFNSDRKGGGHIFRVPASGGGTEDRLAQQITFDEQVDWFPHPSPDGKWLVLLSYRPGTLGHPGYKDVSLRIMALPGDRPSARPELRELAKLFGGQGTINVNSWSPDSKRLAYVAYELAG